LTVSVVVAVLSLTLCTAAVWWITIRKSKEYRWVIGLVLLSSFFVTTFYNLVHDAYAMAWLCNITAVLAIVTYFRYSPRVFDVFVYFAWTGDLFTLLGWDNPLCPPLERSPAPWAAFWLKHIAPLALSVYMFRAEGRRVTRTGVRLALATMTIYACLMYVYDVLLDQNILDLIAPSIPADQAFGPWPMYVVVNVILCFCWYAALHWCLKRLGLVEGGVLSRDLPAGAGVHGHPR
jgi:uncharacterized membrane protein YwaF